MRNIIYSVVEPYVGYVVIFQEDRHPGYQMLLHQYPDATLRFSFPDWESAFARAREALVQFSVESSTEVLH